jgi:lipopolysaccharide/colanic/teichoic acid biosynthesis glycosyltransferase
MDYVQIKQPRVFPHRLVYRWAKRILDVTFCLVALPFALLISAICAVAIRLDTPGPILFVQRRIGRGGLPFQIYKFRTLCVDIDDVHCRDYMKHYVKGQIDCDESGRTVFKPLQAEQITRVGRILRKTSLDELPQLVNVLKGEMSIVGPRPNVDWEVDEYCAWHHERLEVLPGITGLAQVRGRSCIDFGTLVRADIEYIENQSLLLDIQILWWTAKSIVLGRGAA